MEFCRNNGEYGSSTMFGTNLNSPSYDLEHGTEAPKKADGEYDGNSTPERSS